jgi:hypothetical protein
MSKDINTFGDFSKKMKLPKDRQNLKPVNQTWTFDQHLSYALQEGYAILEAEGTGSVTKPDSVKPSPILEDALAKMSSNPYIRARVEILNKMTPLARSVIEKMENNTLPKDHRYDTFCKAVTIKGDQISSK